MSGLSSHSNRDGFNIVFTHSPHLVNSFEQLSLEFTCNFLCCRKKRIITSKLFQIQKRKGDPLKDFYTCFNLIMNEIPNLYILIASTTFIKTTTNINLLNSFSKFQNSSLAELIARQQKYI